MELSPERRQEARANTFNLIIKFYLEKGNFRGTEPAEQPSKESVVAERNDFLDFPEYALRMPVVVVAQGDQFCHYLKSVSEWMMKKRCS